MVPLIMCVDDDPIMHMLSEIILEDNLFCKKILTFLNGKLALEYFSEQIKLPKKDWAIPPIIFLDLNMPVMNGWDFLDCFHEFYNPFHKVTNIIILSSSVNPDDIFKSKMYPLVIDFFPKPLEDKYLVDLKIHDAFSQYFK